MADEINRAMVAQSQLQRRLAKFAHHLFAHSEGNRIGKGGFRPLSEQQARDPAILAEHIEFYNLAIEWAKAGIRYAEVRAGKGEAAAQQQALETTQQQQEGDELEDF